jgi:hypothetical protein
VIQKLLLLVLASLLFATATAAAKKQSKGGDRIAVSEQDLDAEVMFYVEANVLATMYHELAHAFIDMMSLPVFGREEDAADAFVVVITDAFFSDNAAEQLTWASADQYARDADEAEKKGVQSAVLDTDSLDLQRYYNQICLYYGGDVEARKGFAKEFGLPDDRAETCEEERDRAESSWGAVLDGIERRQNGPDWIVLDEDIDTLGNSHVIAAHTVFREEIARLNKRFAPDFRVKVVIENCNQENAFYSPSEGKTTMCNEIVRSYIHD